MTGGARSGGVEAGSRDGAMGDPTAIFVRRTGVRIGRGSAPRAAAAAADGLGLVYKSYYSYVKGYTPAADPPACSYQGLHTATLEHRALKPAFSPVLLVLLLLPAPTSTVRPSWHCPSLNAPPVGSGPSSTPVVVVTRCLVLQPYWEAPAAAVPAAAGGGGAPMAAATGCYVGRGLFHNDCRIRHKKNRQ